MICKHKMSFQILNKHIPVNVFYHWNPICEINKKKGRNHNVFYHWNRLCEINKLLTRIDHNFLDASKLNAHEA